MPPHVGGHKRKVGGTSKKFRPCAPHLQIASDATAASDYVTDEVKQLDVLYLTMFLSCIGNDDLHLLTSDGRQVLRIDLEDWDGNKRYATYDNFNVGSEQQHYILSSLGTYSGNSGQCITMHDLVYWCSVQCIPPWHCY